ncbi:hypothetical protein GCM10023310_66460 [Paenibacillus vulneris]|uniref:Chondroitinase-B domain-containing protein n=1 Tax=Paenibacillus vulneris TaxID=1133364 RepID=A0ABW3UK42_9BACL
MRGQMLVTDKDSLCKAIQTTVPGDTIVMANGIWDDIQLELDVSGTREQPITLKAETAGEVIVTGASTLTFAGEHLVVDGLFFKEGLQPGNNGSHTIIRFMKNSHHCRLTNTAIIDFVPSQPDIKTFWVTIDGSHHEVDHCYFKGKLHAGQLMRSMKYSSYNRIHTNYFVDVPAYGINGLEIIQVMGIGSDGEPGSAGGEHVVIENNLFERADGECEEVISIKSNHDVIRNNTFKDSIGGLVIRSGHTTVVEGNWFLGGNVGGTKGIRITGEDNVISHNYLSGLQGFAISVMSGEYIDEPLTPDWQPILREGTPLGRVPVYNWSRNNTIRHNQMIHNQGFDMDIGIGYKTAWPSKQRILLPEQNEISDNVIVKERGESLTFADQDPEVMEITFAPNYYANNQMDVPDKAALLPPGFVHQELQTHALGNTGYVCSADLGKEVGWGGRAPLSADEVGPDWTKAKRKEGSPLFQPRDQFTTVESVPWDASKNIWVLCAGSSDMFVRNWRMKLHVIEREQCPFEREGILYIPVLSLAQRLGYEASQNVETNEIQIRGQDRALTIRPDGCVVRSGESMRVVPLHSRVRRGALYIDVREAAELMGKSLYKHEQGIVVLADNSEDLTAFKQELILDQTRQLFKVTASRFHKLMTIPPEGHQHGHVPCHTLQEDPALQWISYGDGEWIRYDLGRAVEVGGADIGFTKGGEERYSFSIEASQDGWEWKELVRGISSSEQESVRFKSANARYVRIIGHGNERNHAIRIYHVQWYSERGENILL